MDLSKKYKEKMNLLHKDYKARQDKAAREYYKQTSELHKEEKFDREALLSQFYNEMIANGETATFRYELREDENSDGYFLKWICFPTNANASALRSIMPEPLTKLPSFDKMEWKLNTILDGVDADEIANYEIEVIYKITTDGRDVQWEKM